MKFGSYQVSVDADRSGEEKAFADLTPEEREKCRKFWLKFRILERLHWGVLLVPTLLLWFPGLDSEARAEPES